MSKIIIDGYNLLAQSHYQSRDEMLRDLKNYQKSQGHQITVFFDGTHDGTGAGDKYFEEHVEVIFSPLTVTADDMMEEYIEKHHSPSLVVVSSDSRIQKAPGAKRLSYLESKEFLFKLKYVPASGQKKIPIEKPWMEGRTTEEVGTRKIKKGGNPRKKSKTDRQKQRTMKKL